MQVFFTSRQRDVALLRERIGERLRFALKRVSVPIASAHVRLDDVNGPRGGVDKRCTLALKAEGVGLVRVQARASGWRQAFEEALTRLARSLVRLWKRLRAPPAPSRQAIGAQPRHAGAAMNGLRRLQTRLQQHLAG